VIDPAAIEQGDQQQPGENKTDKQQGAEGPPMSWFLRGIDYNGIVHARSLPDLIARRVILQARIQLMSVGK
jgi:hypothetical protein